MTAALLQSGAVWMLAGMDLLFFCSRKLKQRGLKDVFASSQPFCLETETDKIYIVLQTLILRDNAR